MASDTKRFIIIIFLINILVQVVMQTTSFSAATAQDDAVRNTIEIATNDTTPTLSGIGENSYGNKLSMGKAIWTFLVTGIAPAVSIIKNYGLTQLEVMIAWIAQIILWCMNIIGLIELYMVIKNNKWS